jgi:hypothetical protein
MSSVFPTSSKTIALIIAAVKIPVTFSAALLLKVRGAENIDAYVITDLSKVYRRNTCLSNC